MIDAKAIRERLAFWITTLGQYPRTQDAWGVEIKKRAVNIIADVPALCDALDAAKALAERLAMALTATCEEASANVAVLQTVIDIGNSMAERAIEEKARADRLARKINTELAATKAWDAYMCNIGRQEVELEWIAARKAKEAALAAVLPDDLVERHGNE